MADQSRRQFLKTGAAGLAASTVALSGCSTAAQALESSTVSSNKMSNLGAAPTQFFAAPPIPVIRIGFVGVGGMGTVHVQNFLALEGVEVKAICDINETHARRSYDLVVAKGQKPPKLYTKGERDFERMCAEEDLDLVFTATPWEWHVPVALSAMKNGKHAASEVPFAYRVDDCWALVEAAEKYKKHCVMMENCNYDRDELMVFNMVRQGLLGEVMHGECGYLHDLREIKFSEEGEGLWRREHAKHRNGNLYPTHGLGPIANCMDINRGDAFDYLVSMSGPSRGLQIWAEEHYPADHPKRKEAYKLGDINITLMKTMRGKTVYLSHDTNLPRPYSRIHLLQGTRGLFQGYPSRVYVEGKSEKSHRWDPANKWYEAYDHPLWKNAKLADSKTGHGGMDFMEDYRLIKCLQQGLPTDMNVYDAAMHSAICELTEISVANGSQPVKIPDFTRGQWKNWPKWEIVT